MLLNTPLIIIAFSIAETYCNHYVRQRKAEQHLHLLSLIWIHSRIKTDSRLCNASGPHGIFSRQDLIIYPAQGTWGQGLEKLELCNCVSRLSSVSFSLSLPLSGRIWMFVLVLRLCFFLSSTDRELGKGKAVSSTTSVWNQGSVLRH